MRELNRFNFAEGMAKAWGKKMSLLGAIAIAVGAEDGEIISTSEWTRLIDELIALYPKCITRNTIMKQSAMTFISAHFPDASEALWAGRPNAARNKIMRGSGEKAGTGLFSKNDRLEIARDNYKKKTTKVVASRSLSKKHDWATVK